MPPIKITRKANPKNVHNREEANPKTVQAAKSLINPNADACRNFTSWFWNQAIEAKRETMILRANNNLREQICYHLFGDTEAHLDVTKADIAANQMISDLQVTNVA